MKLTSTLVCAVALLGATAGQATTIDFDDGPGSGAVGSFYSGLGVTFSNANFSSNFGLVGTSGAEAIAVSINPYGVDPASPITATFSTDATSVSLRGIDVGSAGFQLLAYSVSNILLASSSVYGTGVGVGQFFDLTVNAANIHYVTFSQPAYNSGGDGVIFEDFSFDAASPSPEPASWALMLGGFGAIGTALRRRQRTIVSFA